jgi:cobalt-zinc-cadmium efflux system membrane fusion protein
MSSTHRQVAYAAALALTLNVISSPPAFSHGDEIEVSNGGPRGPVSLTEDQVKALGLKFVQADLRPIARLLGVNGDVAVLPDAQTQVSLRISGNVQAVYVNLGDSVRAGQKLALIESRTVGNPPPTVVVPAPADGIVDARNITVGQSVEPNSTLFNLSDRSRMRVVGKVYEEDLGQVRVGQPAFVKLLAYPDELLSGTVSFVGPTLDSETRTVDVWVLLDNKQGLLKPNLFAQVNIVLGENKAALTVPNAAVLEANDEKFVFVHEGEKYNRVDITAGAADDQYTEVLSGIVPGDEVVTQGARQLYTLWLTGGKK